jgi:hypothetical protein
MAFRGNTSIDGYRGEIKFHFPDCYSQSFSEDIYRKCDKEPKDCAYKYDTLEGKSWISVRDTNAVITMLQTELIKPLAQTHLFDLQRLRKPIDRETSEKVEQILRKITGYCDTPLGRDEDPIRQEELWKRTLNVSQVLFKPVVVALVKYIMETRSLDRATSLQQLFGQKGHLADGLSRETHRRLLEDVRNGLGSPQKGLS